MSRFNKNHLYAKCVRGIWTLNSAIIQIICHIRKIKTIIKRGVDITDATDIVLNIFPRINKNKLYMSTIIGLITSIFFVF